MSERSFKTSSGARGWTSHLVVVESKIHLWHVCIGVSIAAIIEDTDEDFYVWSGNDCDTFPILALGGYGVISVASHLVGSQIKDMIDLFFNGDVNEAAVIHRRLLPLFDALFLVSNPVPLKYALNHIGFKVGAPRPPLYEPDEKTALIIKETLKNHRIDLKV